MNDGIIASWADALNIAWHTIADRIINFIPNLLGAILILIIGWILAVLLDRLVDQLMRVIGLQSLAEKMKLEDGIKKVGIKKDFAGLVGAFVKWVIIIVAFLAAAEALQLTQVVEFLNSILNYVPNVAAAARILVFTVLAALVQLNVAYNSFKYKNNRKLTMTNSIGRCSNSNERKDAAAEF